MAKALFLDRDGVINVEKVYAYRIDQMEFIDGIFDVCRAAKERGYLLIVVTNQSGSGHGMYSKEDFHILNDWMKARFVEEGVPLDKVYFCPHHPERGIGEYKRECDDRKPNPGMMLRAQKEFNLDLKESLLIGDKLIDMEAAENAGLGGWVRLCPKKCDLYPSIQNLRDAIKWLR